MLPARYDDDNDDDTYSDGFSIRRGTTDAPIYLMSSTSLNLTAEIRIIS